MDDAPRPLFVFIDESGDLTFNEKGSDYYVMSAFMTDDPIATAIPILELQYEFLVRGLTDQIPFHASENSAGTRKRVTDAIQECAKAECRFWVHSIYANKHRAAPSLHSRERFYSLFGAALAKYLLKERSNYEPVVIMFDSAITKKEQSAFLKAAKPVLNQIGRRYSIAFRPVKEDSNGQIADYYAWSLMRKLQLGDDSPLAALPASHDMFDLFQRGHTLYW